MDFKYAIRDFNHGVFLDYIRIDAVSFECDYVVIWNSCDFDDDDEKIESLMFLLNAKAQNISTFNKIKTQTRLRRLE